MEQFQRVKTYPDTEAEAIVGLLNKQGGEEGNIPYDPEVEFLASTASRAGMSGGGVFNGKGQWVGIMVRAMELKGSRF